MLLLSQEGDLNFTSYMQSSQTFFERKELLEFLFYGSFPTWQGEVNSNFPNYILQLKLFSHKNTAQYEKLVGHKALL